MRMADAGWKAASGLASLFAAFAMGWVASVSADVREHGEKLASRESILRSTEETSRENEKQLHSIDVRVVKIEAQVEHNGEALKRIEQKLDQIVNE